MLVKNNVLNIYIHLKTKSLWYNCIKLNTVTALLEYLHLTALLEYFDIDVITDAQT